MEKDFCLAIVVKVSVGGLEPSVNVGNNGGWEPQDALSAFSAILQKGSLAPQAVFRLCVHQSKST